MEHWLQHRDLGWKSTDADTKECDDIGRPNAASFCFPRTESRSMNRIDTNNILGWGSLDRTLIRYPSLKSDSTISIKNLTTIKFYHQTDMMFMSTDLITEAVLIANSNFTFLFA